MTNSKVVMTEHSQTNNILEDEVVKKSNIIRLLIDKTSKPATLMSKNMSIAMTAETCV